MNRLHSCCNRGAAEGVDARISSPFSEIKLPAPSSLGIFEGENSFLDQGIVLLHGGEDGAREIIPFCGLEGCPGATEPTPLLPGVGIPFQEVCVFSGLSCNR